MLTREIMGLVALGILWLNAGLVLAVAFRQLNHVRELAARLIAAKRSGDLVRGRLLGDGVVAARILQQTGRAITTRGPDRVLFTDGPQSFEVVGGHVELEDGTRIDIGEVLPGQAEVWIDEERTREARANVDAETFEAAWSEATKYKGHVRTLRVELSSGADVWLLGRRDGDVMQACDDRPLLLSVVDPVAWSRGRARLAALFMLGATASLVAVTVVTLWPPRFGLISTLGGALCVAYFLAIQPLGTKLRDALKTPARRSVGALWTRP